MPMVRRCTRTLLACAAWLPATAALATGEPPKVQMKAAPEGAEAPAAPPGTIVAPVTVESATPAELRVQTFRFVQTFSTPSPKIEQVTRWTDPICVTVQGLPADQAAKMKARVEEVGKALGLYLGQRGCIPNIEIKASARPQPFLDKVAREHEDMLGYWHARDHEKLKQVTRPIQAWYRTASIGAGNTAVSTFATVITGTIGAASQGQDAPVATRKGTAGRQASGEIIDDPYERAPTGCADNQFVSCLRSVFDHVLVMIDTKAVQGADIGLIADYVAVVSLSQPKSLDACNGLQSVLDIYASACAGRESPNGLTRADVAYLNALYKANPEARKASQQGDIANRMADLLLKADKADGLARTGGVETVSTNK